MIMRKSGRKGLLFKILAGLEVAFVVCEVAIGAGGLVHSARADTMSIPLDPAHRVTKISRTYSCAGSQALLRRLGAPSVTVTYLNAGAVSLAVMRVEGETQVFSNVISGSGARYTANRFQWWDKGDMAYFSEVGVEDEHPLICQAIAKPAARRAH